MASFNYLIVGAGSAGAPLAARLSESSAARVLLLEAGPDYPTVETTPRDLLDARRNASVGHDWEYVADPVPGRTIPYTRGKLVGGTSAINAALAVRAPPADFKEWAALGNDAWAWEEILPYFRRLEDDRDYHDELHGVAGPLPICRWRLEELYATQRAFYHACCALGMPHVSDHNHPRASGVGAVPMNRVGMTRISTAHAYLDGARSRLNLSIRPHSLVTRIVFQGRQAVGVELLGHTGVELLYADRIVLAAGAIGSPAILLRSGLGPADELRALGITPLVDLPGVGANLRDHPTVAVWLVPRPEAVEPEAPQFQVLARYTAPGSFDADDMMLAMVTCEQPSQDAPFAPLISVGLMRPSATGRVALISRDPAAQPYVSLNYVSHPEDMRRLIDGVRLAVRIAQSAEMAETIADIADIDVAMLASDDRLGEYVRGTVDTFCHALGTARMGPETDKRAVVDQYCRVRGVENLWVADASVMPTVPHVMPNLTTIMIGERVADWLR